MSNISAVDPFRCRMWAFHDRMEVYLTEQACRFEIESVSTHGQLVPVLGRPVTGEPDYDVELIYGARRLFVARQLKKPLLVELRAMSDREAVVAMDIENRLRKDVSPYERGLSFARCLRSGFFRSQEELASSLRISRAQVSRLLAFAKLPAVIISAFADPRDICETWGQELLKALDNPLQRQRTLDRARRLAQSPPRRALDTFNELVCLPDTSRKRRGRTEEVVRDAGGAPLFRVRQMRNDLAVLIPAKRLSSETMTELRTAIQQVLRVAGAENGTRQRGLVNLFPSGLLD